MDRISDGYKYEYEYISDWYEFFKLIIYSNTKTHGQSQAHDLPRNN
jgi:hypothetical protein